MKILVLNAGSSSLKYQLFDMDNGNVLAKGLCERIGTDGKITHKLSGAEPLAENRDFPDHQTALSRIIELLTSETYGAIKSISEIDAIGHRVAHGGERFRKSSKITESVIKYLESIVEINPLHGPPAIAGMKACLSLMPDTCQVAVFDTSFYSDIEDFRYIYPIPYEFYEKDHIRRYGFHGTSHRYVSGEMANLLGKDIRDLKIITCHLGNGSSITAVDGGKAIDTSMGFTPQEGIAMGTRSGSIDPTVVTYIMKKKGYTPDEMENILNKKSGLVGVSGISNDCRDIWEAIEKGDKRAELSIKILANGIKKYIGSYVAEMNGLDALVFTAGIGEKDEGVREAVCTDMEYLGIKIDKEKNNHIKKGVAVDISTPDSKVRVWVVPTDEEYMIAKDTMQISQEQE